MKKYLSMILVIAIAAVLSISAFAAPTLPGNQTVDVTLELQGSIEHRYSADIEYTDNMTFTYSAAGVEWTVTEDEGYSYGKSEQGWTVGEQTLKIINHSDLELGYTVSMEKAAKYNELNFTLNGNATAYNELEACTVTTPYGEVYGTVAVVVTGDIPGSALDGDNLGVLKVVFNAVS